MLRLALLVLKLWVCTHWFALRYNVAWTDFFTSLRVPYNQEINRTNWQWVRGQFHLSTHWILTLNMLPEKSESRCFTRVQKQRQICREIYPSYKNIWGRAHSLSTSRVYLSASAGFWVRALQKVQLSKWKTTLLNTESKNIQYLFCKKETVNTCQI